MYPFLFFKIYMYLSVWDKIIKNTENETDYVWSCIITKKKKKKEWKNSKKINKRTIKCIFFIIKNLYVFKCLETNYKKYRSH